jgi:septal ring-binding cell division protein DamX
MLNQNGGSRTDTLIKLVLVFFLSLLSFSVGTFVGKQFSDSQHKIAELENSGLEGDRGTASIPPDTAKVEPGQAITEEEISKLSDEFVKKEKSHGAPAADAGTAHNDGFKGPVIGEEKAAPTAKKTEQKKSASIHDEIANVAKKIASGQKVEAPKVAPSRIPSALPKELSDSALGKFTVQMSSHPNEAAAEKAAQELRDKGFSAFYVAAEINGKTWYRVCDGKFTNRTEALAHKDKLAQSGIKSSIIQKIAQ